MTAQGHEDQFPVPGTSARYGFGKETFDGWAARRKMRRDQSSASIPPLSDDLGVEMQRLGLVADVCVS